MHILFVLYGQKVKSPVSGLFFFFGGGFFFFCQAVKDVIRVYAIIGTRPNIPYTKYGG